jgi:GNAT superfamily N-acetyltransferase
MLNERSLALYDCRRRRTGLGKGWFMHTAEITIRQARLDEAEQLTELALRSKASWGYSEEFMAACRDELTFTAAKLAAWDVWVAVVNERLAGMLALRFEPEAAKAEIEDFFVEPALQGRGIGAALAAAALAACRLKGVQLVSVDADPNAEAIYRRFGFRSTSRSPSGSIPGRTLPRMELQLSRK